MADASNLLQVVHVPRSLVTLLHELQGRQDECDNQTILLKDLQDGCCRALLKYISILLKESCLRAVRNV